MLLELLKIAYGALLISVYCFWRYAVIPPLVTWAVGPETWRHAVVVYGFVLWLVVKTWASETRSIEYVREGEEDLLESVWFVAWFRLGAGGSGDV
jgi:hypothetical protein